jgi:hypothetical protein
MGGARSKIYIKIMMENIKGSNSLGDLSVEGRITLDRKLILKEEGVKMWLRVRFKGWLLRTR